MTKFLVRASALVSSVVCFTCKTTFSVHKTDRKPSSLSAAAMPSHRVVGASRETLGVRARFHVVVVLLVVALVDLGAPGADAANREIDDYHYVFSADCAPYMTWQARALYDSWRAIGSPGRLTRLLSCTDAQYEQYRHFDVVPETVRCPDYTRYGKENLGDVDDWYAAYNLPGGMNHWAQNTEFTDRKWVVKLDADMLLLKPLTVEKIPASKGTTAAGEYGYLVGVDNGMAKWFVDEDVESRLARVGGWEIFDAEDFKKMTPYWLEYTAKVRMEPKVWFPYKGTGDVYVSKDAPRPWISEMYGFIFGCGVAGLRHNVMRSTQLYAGMRPWDRDSADPYIIHYGLKLSGTNGYEWDKHSAEGKRQRMTCETRNETPFPVEDMPVDLASNASRAQRYEYVAHKVRHITVKMINEAVDKYNKEKCAVQTEVKSVRRALREPQTTTPKVDEASRVVEETTHTPPTLEKPRVDDAKPETVRVPDEEHEKRMFRLWTFGTCSWIAGLVALVRYAFPRLVGKAKSRRLARQKNPFR